MTDQGGKRRYQWARAAIDRVPAKWLATGATGVFLAVTAAFGGLAAVPEPPLPVIGPGDTFIGAELEMTPARVTVADELEYSGLFPDEEKDERVLTLIMDVTNLNDVPRRADDNGSPSEVRIEGLADVAPSISRLEDENFESTWLQPNVQTRIALSWVVSAADVADLTEVRVVLHTATEFVGSSVMHGRYWDDVAVAGFADLPVEELPSAEEEPW